MADVFNPSSPQSDGTQIGNQDLGDDAYGQQSPAFDGHTIMSADDEDNENGMVYLDQDIVYLDEDTDDELINQNNNDFSNNNIPPPTSLSLLSMKTDLSANAMHRSRSGARRDSLKTSFDDVNHDSALLDEDEGENDNDYGFDLNKFKRDNNPSTLTLGYKPNTLKLGRISSQRPTDYPDIDVDGREETQLNQSTPTGSADDGDDLGEKKDPNSPGQTLTNPDLIEDQQDLVLVPQREAQSAPPPPSVRPTDITIKSRDRAAFVKKPLMWGVGGAAAGAAVGAGVGAAIGGVLGTFTMPVVGTVIGAAGGAVVGAAVGAAVFGVVGIGYGIYRAFKTTQGGHIQQALQRFEQQGYRLTPEEQSRLEDPQIRRKDWRALLHVPDTHWWSSGGVGNKEDRQKIREALIMAVAKTGGNAQQRLAAAQQIKDQLLGTSRLGLPNYRVLDRRDPISLEPDRIRQALPFVDLEQKLLNIGSGALKNYRALVREGNLTQQDKQRLDGIGRDQLVQLLGPAANVGAPGDRRMMRQALLLCAAKEGPAAATALGGELLANHPVRFSVRGSSYTDNVRGFMMLRPNRPPFLAGHGNRIWDRLNNGQSAAIDYSIFDHTTVENDIRKLVDVAESELGGSYDRRIALRLLGFFDHELAEYYPNMTPQERYDLLVEVHQQITKWAVAGELSGLGRKNPSTKRL
ncbi:MAG: hypothetical protein AAF637_12120, partial [Pseudomonadota bacterium]